MFLSMACERFKLWQRLRFTEQAEEQERMHEPATPPRDELSELQQFIGVDEDWMVRCCC